MWLTGRLAPDFKTLADLRRDNGAGIRNVYRRFVVLCRELKLFSEGVVAMEFKASSEDLARICHAHPTLSEVTREAALGVLGRSLNI